MSESDYVKPGYETLLWEWAQKPEWERRGKVHDWRNYVPEDVQKIWDTFTPHQKFLLCKWAEGTADNELWD